MGNTASAKATIDIRDMLRALSPEERRRLLEESDTPARKDRQLNLPVPPGSSRQAPLVSCVLVIGDKARLGIARQAVECFVKQVYARKQLVIVNGVPEEIDLDTRVTNVGYHEIVEQRVAPGQSVGMMRNLGLEAADGDWIMQWDDDDYSHPFRIAYQMAHRDGDRPVFLRQQIRCQYQKSIAFYHVEETGISGTILHPKTSARYQDVGRHEDLLFWTASWGANRVVVDNVGRAAKMSLAFYHGRNVTPEDEWMSKYPAEMQGRTSLDREDLDYLVGVCKLYGLNVNKTPAPSSQIGPRGGAEARNKQAVFE
jgi:hypothetical protein